MSMQARFRERAVSLGTTFLAASLLLAGGCKNREQEALDKAAQRKPPGYVRAVNLSNAEVELVDRGRPLNRIASGQGSKATTLSSGKRTVDVKVGGKSVPVEFEVEPRMVYTIVVWPDGAASAVSGGLPRNPEDLVNTWVVAANHSGVDSAGAGQILGPGAKKVDLKNGQSVNLQAGDYASLDGSQKVRINPQYCYTVLFLDDGGKKRTFLLTNSDDRRPAAAGTAAN